MFRFFSKGWENFKEYIILVILLIISLITLSLNSKPQVKYIRSLAFSAFASATSLLSDMINITQLRNENINLRLINSRLMLRVNMMRQYEYENKELKGLLALKDSTNYPLISASIVSRSLSTTQNTITINAGSDLGVKPGMPVINDNGMVGIVFSTSDNYAIARTLYNTDLKLTVKDQRSRADAIMKWNGNLLAMVNVPKTYDIEQGDTIITSEISSIVPVPLPVGVVQNITKMETGIFNDVTIIPFVNPDKVENVFVIALVESKEKNGLELNFYKRK